jgi:tRNA threonylcarbamoyladenosine biosynthesis protein TsaB
MNILAIDTATGILGLCLKSESESRTFLLQAGLKHSEKLMPAVRTLLLEAELAIQELELIVCSIGPGSFTGIRIGLATAKGLAAGIKSSGRQCRLIGVSTLDGLVHRYRRFPGDVVAVNPSLRKKHYAAVYRGGLRSSEYLETTVPELSAALLRQRTRGPALITGRGACELYERLLSEDSECGRELFVDASAQACDPQGLLACGAARLGEADGEPVPLYLRKSEAEITFFGE